jgi:hypothetical protein
MQKIGMFICFAFGIPRKFQAGGLCRRTPPRQAAVNDVKGGTHV